MNAEILSVLGMFEIEYVMVVSEGHYVVAMYYP